MKRTSLLRMLFAALLPIRILATAGASQASDASLLYLDPKQPIPVRVEDLLQRMTLEEKIGQLNLPCAYVEELGKTPDEGRYNHGRDGTPFG